MSGRSLLLATLLFAQIGCGYTEELLSIRSPDGTRAAVHVRKDFEGALGDFTHEVVVVTSDHSKTVWDGDRVDPIYLIWADDETLEVYVLTYPTAEDETPPSVS